MLFLIKRMNWYTNPYWEIFQFLNCLFLAVVDWVHSEIALFICDQAALRTFLSVRLSVHYTLFTMFLSFHHHGFFWSYYHWQKLCSCKRSMLEVNGQDHRGQNKFCPEFTNGYGMMHRVCSGIEEFPYCFCRSSIKFQGHTDRQMDDFGPNWAFPDYNSSLNLKLATKLCTKLEVA